MSEAANPNFIAGELSSDHPEPAPAQEEEAVNPNFFAGDLDDAPEEQGEHVSEREVLTPPTPIRAVPPLPSVPETVTDEEIARLAAGDLGLSDGEYDTPTPAAPEPAPQRDRIAELEARLERLLQEREAPAPPPQHRAAPQAPMGQTPEQAAMARTVAQYGNIPDKDEDPQGYYMFSGAYHTHLAVEKEAERERFIDSRVERSTMEARNLALESLALQQALLYRPKGFEQEDVERLAGAIRDETLRNKGKLDARAAKAVATRVARETKTTNHKLFLKQIERNPELRAKYAERVIAQRKAANRPGVRSARSTSAPPSPPQAQSLKTPGLEEDWGEFAKKVVAAFGDE